MKSKAEILTALKTTRDYIQNGENGARRTRGRRLDRFDALNHLEALIEMFQREDVEVVTQQGRKV